LCRQETARTGQGILQVVKEREDALHDNKGWLVGWTRLDISTEAQFRRFWDHVVSFSPLPALSEVNCGRSPDRADFVGSLFSRVQPTGLDTKTTSAALFAAYDNTEVDPGLLAKNLDTIKAI